MLAETGPVGEPQVSLSPGQSLDSEPEPVTLAQAKYPAFALDAGIEGTVVLDVLVDETGHLSNIKVAHPVTGLDQAAVDAAKRSVFKPAMKDGRPVPAWMKMSVTFSR